ncbi:hypothetical protein BDK51DRAFT_49031 [Blyttiomyces helicus]|uniref:Uncharacterized protein n=1 Tax=Blyttiomyces helicus TaxID=388810 RepID=A0A4P9VXL7_9FUNG|nr:hypothetical protein BDK51DRAFT_49031 [Blyttiomyces helicus]|eukprot:RKO84474.1 hypothetical protein BDK51DRAFT_49031 [Blyttiomyces helicus]
MSSKIGNINPRGVPSLLIFCRILHVGKQRPDPPRSLRVSSDKRRATEEGGDGLRVWDHESSNLRVSEEGDEGEQELDVGRKRPWPPSIPSTSLAASSSPSFSTQSIHTLGGNGGNSDERNAQRNASEVIAQEPPEALAVSSLLAIVEALLAVAVRLTHALSGGCDQQHETEDGDDGGGSAKDVKSKIRGRGDQVENELGINPGCKEPTVRLPRSAEGGALGPSCGPTPHSRRYKVAPSQPPHCTRTTAILRG